MKKTLNELETALAEAALALERREPNTYTYTIVNQIIKKFKHSVR